MGDDDHRVPAGRVVVLRVEEPALDGAGVAFPVKALRLAPETPGFRVQRGDLPPRADGPRPDLGRVLEGLADDGRGATAPGSVKMGELLGARGERRELRGRRVDRRDPEAAVEVPREEELARRAPDEAAGGPAHSRRQVARRATGGRHLPDVAAVGALVAHDPVDDGDGAAVGREPRARDLKRRLPDRARLAGGGIHDVELGHPVVVGPRAGGRLRGERLPIGGPVVVVDEEARGRDQARLSRRQIRDRDALDLRALLDGPGVPGIRDQGAGLLRRPLDEEKRHGLARRRPAQLLELALHARELPGGAAGRRGDPDLELAGACRRPREMRSIARPARRPARSRGGAGRRRRPRGAARSRRAGPRRGSRRGVRPRWRRRSSPTTRCAGRPGRSRHRGSLGPS